MSLDHAVRVYNDIEQQQLDRLAKIYEILQQSDGSVLVLSGPAGEPGTEEIKSFNSHQLARLLDRYNRTITFWSLGHGTTTTD